MAYPDLQAAPSPEQLRRFDAFLAELGPAKPADVQMEPEWDGYGWTLWVPNLKDVGTGTFDAFVEICHELAETHDVDISVRSTIAKQLDD